MIKNSITPKALLHLLTQGIVYERYNCALFCQEVELAQRKVLLSSSELELFMGENETN